MINELLKDVIGDFPGWLALFLQLVGKGEAPHVAAVEVAKQRLPNIFGFGRADEQIFESIRQLMMPAEKRRLIDLVMGEMKDYEENLFRLTVAGINCGSEITEEPVKNPPKGTPTTTKKTVSWDSTPKDLRVKYLEDIADEVIRLSGELGEEFAAALVVAGMRSRRLITRNPSWEKATKWIETNVLEFFDIESFDELTEDVMATRLNMKVEDLVQRYPETLSIKSTAENIGSRIVVRERLQVEIPGVFSLMAKDVGNVFSKISSKLSSFRR